MRELKAYEDVKLEDGREGTIVEILGDQRGFLVDVGSSPRDWETILVTRDEIVDD